MSSGMKHGPSGANEKWFTTTHWSVVLAAGRTGSPDAEAALEKLCQDYWYPLYAYVRRRGHGPHDAQDLTQGFFATVLERNFLGSAEQTKGKFRSFLLGALNNFLSRQRQRALAGKRGGGKLMVPLDEESAESLYALEDSSDTSPERAFEKRWAITLLEKAFASLRQEFDAAGKGEMFESLKGFLSDRTGSGDYGSAAAELGMTPNAVAVSVHRLRQRYRELVRMEVGHTVASPGEIEAEMRHLFAALGQ